VGGVSPGGPAADAGISVGDVILSVAAKHTPTTTALGAVLAGLDPGKSVQVMVRDQSGSRRIVRVTLGQYPGG
jgi:S1-C subfamily serine protease